MRKLREVLRLRYELKLGYQQIGRSCAIAVSTVHKYLKRAEAAGVKWPLPEDWDEARLEAALFPEAVAPGWLACTRPTATARSRAYRFVALGGSWRSPAACAPRSPVDSSKLDVVLRQEHKAGEKMFVDWAGATIPVYDRHTGVAWQAPLFVAALGASSYTWAEATRDQQMEAWLKCHVHAFEHFHGIPQLAVPDNCKTGVTKAHRYDPDLNPTYYNFAVHCDYRTARGLDKSVIRALAQKSAWVEQHENIFVLGPTGVGKSFVACALAQKACRDGYSAMFVRAPALFRDLAIARADGSLRSVLTRFSRIDVLVIDDWAMAPLAETERRDFWEICEDRYQTRSTILTSQLPVTRWHEQIGDATAADGILDRLVHNAHRIEMRGDSMRKKRGTSS